MGGLFLLSAIFSALAVDQLTLSIEKIDGATWQAEHIDLQLEWFPSSKSAYRLEIGKIQLPQLAEPIENLTLDCLRGLVTDQSIQCDNGKLHVTGLKLDKPDMQVHFRLDLDTLNLQAGLKQIAVARGKLDLKLSTGKNRWKIDLRARYRYPGIDKWPPLNRAQGRVSYSGYSDP
ncbi:hypothetical protein [endosymbiont of Lamellibrachia barhami]|uniref:hypothetical protein n=1 Tax=endosymbiont of Lamellibrachia barhami TaxID=205975 RepID=UPI0015AF2455|nr:hypothetical protein [endosymbiont of Lamellibrachia barhami]